MSFILVSLGGIVIVDGDEDEDEDEGLTPGVELPLYMFVETGSAW